MAFEKAKVIKAAEKFLSQGKISAAIKEYRQIINNDPDDLTTLNMLGDLLARAGEKEEAATCFLRIAEHYREQEFRLKAIAMYRKIEKLKPRDPVIARELAELYSAQGLIADARTQYLVVADAYTRSGESREALKVLHKIADLDPHNTEIRLKLADGYLKERMPAESAKAYGDAANRLFESSQFEKALAAYAKALELRPHDMPALKGLVAAHAALGTADEAADILEKAVADSPDEPELVSMLAKAYIDAEDAGGAERATAQLLTHDASNYRRYVEVTVLYLKLNEQDAAARILGLIIEPMLAGREENDILELVNELLARDPEHVPSLRLLARIHWWQRDMEKLRAALERLAEAAEAAGLDDDERYALTQLVRLAPDEQRYVDRVNALGGSLEEAEATLLNNADVATLPSSESVTPVDFEFAAVDDAPSASEFEWNSVAETESTHVGVSFADLNEVDETPDGDSAATLLDSALTDPFAVSPEPAGAGDGIIDTVGAMMSQELESVDFYITQGYSDIAIDTLDLLERQFGRNPQIDVRRAKLQPSDQSSETSAFEVVTEPAVSNAEVVEQNVILDATFGDIEIVPQPFVPEPSSLPKAPAGSGLDSGLAEIFEEFRLEAEGESAGAHEDFETHFNMATAYKEMDLLDEAIREFQVAAGMTGSADGTPRYFHCCNMLGHCFVQKGMPQAAVLWFKKGLDAPGRSAEESKALQYELGSAYEAMGDLRRASDAFTEVYGVDVGYRDIADKLASLQLRIEKRKKGK